MDKADPCGGTCTLWVLSRTPEFPHCSPEQLSELTTEMPSDFGEFSSPSAHTELNRLVSKQESNSQKN